MIDEKPVLSDLECPVCLLTPRISPIYQCSKGHLVCSECRPRLVNCPLCNIDYNEDLIRSTFAEKMLEKVVRGCRYQVNDCTFKSRSSEALIEHETDCGFKPPDIVQEDDINGIEHSNGLEDINALEVMFYFVFIVYHVSKYMFVFVLALQTAKMYYGLVMTDFLGGFKPAVILLTGIFILQIYLYGSKGWMRKLVLGCVVVSSICLVGAEYISNILFIFWKYFFVVHILINGRI